MKYSVNLLFVLALLSAGNISAMRNIGGLLRNSKAFVVASAAPVGIMGAIEYRHRQSQKCRGIRSVADVASFNDMQRSKLNLLSPLRLNEGILRASDKEKAAAFKLLDRYGDLDRVATDLLNSGKIEVKTEGDLRVVTIDGLSIDEFQKYKVENIGIGLKDWIRLGLITGRLCYASYECLKDADPDNIVIDFPGE